MPHAGACPYCMMLGSRGLEYNSKKTVMASRHDGCGCTPVVDLDRKNPKLKGYDPDALYDQWKHPEIYEGMAHETRWMVSSLRAYEASGKARYHKPISSFVVTDDERDLFAHKAILDAGRELDVLKEDAPDGHSNIDLLIDGVKYEAKIPSTADRALSSRTFEKPNANSKSNTARLKKRSALFSTGPASSLKTKP